MRELNWKLSTKKNEYTSGNNISRIYSETSESYGKSITKSISNQLDIKLGQFTQEELDLVLRKIKNRKAASLEMPPEVWKTREFDDIQLRYCNTVYDQNTIDRWTNGYILPFPKKGDLGIAKNYWVITLTAIEAKIYNALLLNHIKPTIEKILRKNQNGFRRKRSSTSQILTIHWILEGVHAKKPVGDTIICRPLQGIWLHTQKEDGANTSSLRFSERNCRSHNDAILKHRSKSSIIGWKHRLLWHSSRRASRRYISPIHVYYLPWLLTPNVYRFNERKRL